MKNLTIVILLLFISIIACKSNENIETNQSKKDSSRPLLVNMPSEIKLRENLPLDIYTKIDSGVLLYDPMLLRIEKLNTGKWEPVRILHCPCGANCIPPPREKLLQKDEKWAMSWNLIESWCEKGTKDSIPETIEKHVIPGKYRIILFYSYNNKNRIKLTKEFQIIY